MIRLFLLPLLISSALSAQKGSFYAVKNERTQELLQRMGLMERYDSIVAPSSYEYAVVYVCADSLRFDSLKVINVEFLCSQKRNGTYQPIRICPAKQVRVPFSWLDAYISEGAELHKAPSVKSTVLYTRPDKDEHRDLEILAQQKDKKGTIWLEVGFTMISRNVAGAMTLCTYQGWIRSTEIEIYRSQW